MPESQSIKETLLKENEELRLRLSEAEETLNAIRSGEVDAIVVSGKNGERIFSLASAETPYRIILEEMNEGAIVVNSDGLILYCNHRFSEMVSCHMEQITGANIRTFIASEDIPWFNKLFRESLRRRKNGMISCLCGNGSRMHAQFSFVALSEDIQGDICIMVSDITEIKDHQDFLQGMVDKRTAELQEANNLLTEYIAKLEKNRITLEASSKKYKLLYKRMCESEDMYEELVESANSIIMKADTNGYITFMNRFSLKFFGYTKEEAIGRHVIGTTIPQKDSTGRDLTEFAELIIKEPDKFQINEHENMRKDGSLVWVSWTNKAIRDRKGNFIGILSIGNDISALKNAEKALIESEGRFRLIVETAAEGLATASPEGRYIYVNSKMAEMLGYPVEEILGKSSLDFMYFNDKENVLRARKEIKKGNISGEFKFRRKDGSLLWTSYNASPLFDSQGNYVANLALHTDITQRKKSEEDLYKIEERFRSAFEKGAIAMLLTSLEGKFLKVNKAFCQLTGYSEQELTSMSFREITHPDDLDLNIDGLNKLRNGEIPTFRMVKRYIRKDHSIVWVDMSTATVRDVNGDLDYLVTHVQDINKQKVVEAVLRESEEKYKELVQSSRTIIMKQDQEGKFTFINEYAQSLFGFDETEIIGKTPLETIVPEIESTGRRLDQTLKKIYGDPDKYSVHINENIKKNGERLWIEWHNKAIFDNDGNRLGHIAVGLDITDRISTQESLKRSEERYRLLFEQMSEAFALHEIIFDESGKPCDYRFLSANPSFEKQTGLKVNEIIGKRVREVLPQTENYWIEEYGEVAMTGKSRDIENFSSALNRYYRVSAFSPRPGQFATLFEDITVRRLAENALRESREKLEIALESGHIGTWERNLKNNEVICDERMEKIFGLKPGTFNRTYSAFEDLIDEEDLPHFRKAIARLLEKGALSDTVFRTRSGSGASKFVSTKAVVIKDNMGTPVSINGVCFDVTEMKKGTEKAILKLNDELLRSNKELESFAYVASHDLQEPLRMVSSFTQMLEQRYGDKLDQDAHDYIKYSVDGAKRMYELINGLLAYSRVQTKGKAFVEVNMEEVLEKVKRNLSLRITEKNARITNNVLPKIVADESQMIQLVQNLLENSIKFSPGSPKIHFSSVTNPDNYLFSVKDEGMGIDPQYFERIFKIFQRLFPKEDFEGTGIGLAICRRIVERHDGKIWVESEPGIGTTFLFTIPKR